MAKKSDAVNVSEVNPDVFMVTVEGLTGLIVGRWSEKAKHQMRTKQTKGMTERKQLKNPAEEFEAAKYKDPATGREGVSVLSFKSSMVDAAQYLEGKFKKYLKGCFFLVPDFFDEDGTPCYAIEGKATMREDFPRNNSGVPDIRYRPMYWPWRVTLKVSFDRSIITPEQIVGLLNRAGFSGGVGAWRPSSPKSSNGEFGRFRVVSHGDAA